MNLFSILAILNNLLVWMVSSRPLISKSSSSFNNPLVTTVPKVPITIGIILTFVFHIFFLFACKARYISFFSISVLFCRQAGQQSLQFCKFSSFLLIIIRSRLLAEIRWSIFMSKSQGVYVCHPPWGVPGHAYTFCSLVKFKFLAKLAAAHLAHLVVSSLICLLW